MKDSSKITLPVFCLLVFAALLGGPAARARDATEVAGAQSALEEVVVTARKRSERSIDVPISITAFSQEQIQRYASNNLELIARATPGLVIGPTTGASGSAINLRGIGGSVTTFTVEQAVALNIDGVQVAQSGASRLGLFGLDRIEVLKGPQVLFFGKNSSAGVISLVSGDPTSEFEAQVKTGYEIYNKAASIEGMISGPLTDAIGARLDVTASRQDGWFRNQIKQTSASGRIPDETNSLNQDELSGRVTLAYASDDGKLDAKLKVSATQQDQEGGYESLVQYVNCPFGRPAITRTVAGASTDCSADRNFIAARAPPEALINPLYGNGEANTGSTLYLASLAASYKLADDLSLESTTGYYRAREDRFSSFPFAEVVAILRAVKNGYEQASQEFRLRSSFAGRFNFMAGAYLEKSTLDLFDQPLALGPPALPSYRVTTNQSWEQKGEAVSMFGQVSYNILDDLILGVGARWSQEKKSFKGSQNEPSSPTYGPLHFPIQERTFDNLSPEVTLTYRVNPDVNIYATLKSGFKSGGFNLAGSTVPNTDVSFDPEKAKGGEVGVKGLFMDRQVRLDLTGYIYDYDDLQVSAFNSVTLSTSILNAASARVQGVEGTLLFTPSAWPALELRSSASYNDSHYANYIGPCFVGQTVAQGCNRDFNGKAYVSQDLTGKHLVRAPLWTGSLGGSYRHAVGDGYLVELSSDATYSDDYPTDPTYAPGSFQSSYWRWDASIALGDSDDKWRLALVGRNLTNELVLTNANAAPLSGSATGTPNAVLADEVASIGAPRTVALELTLHF